MNAISEQEFNLLDYTLALRHQLMDLLNDEDLSYMLPGNPSLGTLCKAIGETDRSYIDSFKTFKQDFSYKHDDPTIATSVDKLKAWYDSLETELKDVLHKLSDEGIEGKMIDRGSFQLPVGGQFHTYREALLIFYAKASVYLLAMGKTVPDQFQQWIG